MGGGGDGFLHRYFLANGGRRLHKWVHYFDIYVRHFERFRGRCPTMVEIGVGGGGSLEMWKAYLGEGAKLIGIDVNPNCKQFEADGIEIFVGGQEDTDLFSQILAKYGTIDIVLDDGSHVMSHMRATFDFLYEKMSPTGVYMVEDMHTCYLAEYEGGIGVPGSFMEFVKTKLDEINAVYTSGAIPISEFTRSTQGICCYDSIVAFERRPQGRRQSPVTEPLLTYVE